jgi:agmatine deiminase
MTSTNTFAASQTYMPEETAQHEGTWLQWPHHYTYGTTYRNQLDATWVAMTKALVQSEKVHIVAYNATEQKRITTLLLNAGVPLGSVSFLISQTDDVWVRDNGPVFVRNQSGQLQITDWGFNGWGLDTPYAKDNLIPTAVSKSLAMPSINLNNVVLEGGAIEVDGKGVLLATKSSVLQNKRNTNLTQAQVEQSLSNYLGISKFIWLDGAAGGKEDITDTHIDGFARFGDTNTLVTMNAADLNYWSISSKDINTLYAATNTSGQRYTILKLPLTANNVVTAYGKNLGYKGSYVNYYVGNNVVLVPEYKDANDTVARNLLQSLYPTRSIVGIDVRNLFANGGMVHCVTQQQPTAY